MLHRGLIFIKRAFIINWDTERRLLSFKMNSNPYNDGVEYIQKWLK